MSNIAEGFESRTVKSRIDYLGRSKASAAEVRSQLFIALDQGYINVATLNSQPSTATPPRAAASSPRCSRYQR